MRTGALKRAGGLLMAAVLMLSLVPSAMAAEPESVKEFQNGKTKSVSLLEETIFVVQEDGSLWVQGNISWLGNSGPYDTTKQNHNGTETFYYCTTPKKIMDGVSFVTATTREVAVIKNDDTLWTAGQDYVDGGQLSRQIGFIKRLENVDSVSINERASFAVKKDGTLWAWGWGYIPVDEKALPADCIYGMGEGLETRIIKPVQVLENVKSVSSDFNTTMILKTDGTLLAMGRKDSGRVGIGDLGSEQDPFLTELTPIMSNVKDVHMTFMSVYAIKNDDTLWMWGQLPYLDRNKAPQASPLKLLDDVISARSLAGGLLLLKKDGTVWAQGPQARNGALCDGGVVVNESQIATPRKGILDNVATIESCVTSAAAITFDGTLWVFGDGDRFSWRQSGDEYTKLPVQLTNLSATPPVPTTAPTQTAIAKPTTSKILLDGKAVSLDAYNINSNNYCKIRDVAKLLNGTGKQFEVTWDKTLQAVSMVSNHAYTTVGGELAKGDGESKTATLNTAKIYLDGKEVTLTAYNIGGNNYIKLRDLGQAFDFDVRWDGAASAIVVDTTKGYTG